MFKFSLADKTQRLLVIDDMSISRATSKRLLEEIGFHEIVIAADGEQGWNLLESAVKANSPFSLVLSDWMMPKMDGIQLTKKIKASGWKEIPPVILLTAESDATQIREAVKDGISGYVRKPITKEALLKALTSLSSK